QQQQQNHSHSHNQHHSHINSHSHNQGQQQNQQPFPQNQHLSQQSSVAWLNTPPPQVGSSNSPIHQSNSSAHPSDLGTSH
ncbi:hypothetical protein C6P41_002254, partial [Kluyveromyces marxianus]